MIQLSWVWLYPSLNCILNGVDILKDIHFPPLQAERIDLEERYTTLQEENSGKTRKLKKVWTLLMAAKSELGDMQAEHQREMEALLESVRHLSREHKLHQLIIDSFIPLEYQVKFNDYSLSE